jgi:hypothetical protein
LKQTNPLPADEATLTAYWLATFELCNRPTVEVASEPPDPAIARRSMNQLVPLADGTAVTVGAALVSPNTVTRLCAMALAWANRRPLVRFSAAPRTRESAIHLPNVGTPRAMRMPISEITTISSMSENPLARRQITRCMTRPFS